MPVYKRKLRRRELLWAELNALEHFYFGCPNNRAWEKHKAWIDEQGKWHGSGTFAQVVAWRQIFPWMGDVKRGDRDAEPDKPDPV